MWRRTGRGNATEVIKEVVRRGEDMQLRVLQPSAARDAAVPRRGGRLFRRTSVCLWPGEAPARRDEGRRGRQPVFYVVAAQKKSVEFKIQNEKFLLSAGDHFCVPAHNMYGLRNFSKDAEAS